MGIKKKRLKEQFINDINNDDMVTEIIRELPAVLKTTEITCEQELVWARGVKAQEHKKCS